MYAVHAEFWGQLIVGKMAEMQLEIAEYIRAGYWPTDIEKLTGYPIEMILEVEDQCYGLTNQLLTENNND
jgi:hypothetical protein